MEGEREVMKQLRTREALCILGGLYVQESGGV